MRKLFYLFICLLVLLPVTASAGECQAIFTFTWEGKINDGNRIVVTGLEDNPVVAEMVCLDPEKPGLVHKYKMVYEPCSLPDGNYQITAHIRNAWGVEGVESEVFPIPKDTSTPKTVTDIGLGLE